MDRKYPIPTYNYKVRFNTPQSKVVSFTEVSGLTIQHDEVVYRTGLSFKKGFTIKRGFAKPIQIQLKKGMLAGAGAHDDVHRLQKAFFDYDQLNIFIDLCDTSGNKLISWQVIGAVPMKFELPSLQASSNDIAVESVELLARDLILI